MHSPKNQSISLRTILETRFHDCWRFCCDYSCCRYPCLDSENLAGEAIRKAIQANTAIAPLAVYAYLRCTIDRIAIRMHRRRIPTVHFDCELHDHGPTQNARIEDLEKAIGLLKPKLRAVIELLILGHSIVDVANQLGLSPSAVKYRRNKARKRLNKSLS